MLGIGMPGMSEWLVILVIVLIFFGAGKLPQVMGQFGRGIKAFKDASSGDPEPGDRREGSAAPRAIPADPLDDPASARERDSSRGA
ncbi:MAG: hypothetical protein RLZZ299_506 [Pseudomonadota bacterium]